MDFFFFFLLHIFGTDGVVVIAATALYAPQHCRSIVVVKYKDYYYYVMPFILAVMAGAQTEY